MHHSYRKGDLHLLHCGPVYHQLPLFITHIPHYLYHVTLSTCYGSELSQTHWLLNSISLELHLDENNPRMIYSNIIYFDANCSTWREFYLLYSGLIIYMIISLRSGLWYKEVVVSHLGCRLAFLDLLLIIRMVYEVWWLLPVIRISNLFIGKIWDRCIVERFSPYLIRTSEIQKIDITIWDPPGSLI